MDKANDNFEPLSFIEINLVNHKKSIKNVITWDQVVVVPIVPKTKNRSYTYKLQTGIEVRLSWHQGGRKNWRGNEPLGSSQRVMYGVLGRERSRARKWQVKVHCCG